MDAASDGGGAPSTRTGSARRNRMLRRATRTRGSPAPPPHSEPRREDPAQDGHYGHEKASGNGTVPEDVKIVEEARIGRQSPEETSDDQQSHGVVGVVVAQGSGQKMCRHEHADEVDREQGPRYRARPRGSQHEGRDSGPAGLDRDRGLEFQEQVAKQGPDAASGGHRTHSDRKLPG